MHSIMALVDTSDSFCSISVEDQLLLLDLKKRQACKFELPKVNVKVKGTNDKSEKKQVSERPIISAIKFSGLCNFLAVADDIKQLHILKLQDGAWAVFNSRLIPKRSTSLIFTKDEKWILVADKSGDVTRFSVSDVEHPADMVAGHLSMLLDLTLLGNDAYLATCDRDEKVRISHYPNCYHIHHFLLAHTDYVSQVVPLDTQGLLLSASGDGRVILWDYEQGQQLSCLDTHIHLDARPSVVCSQTVPNQSEKDNPCRGCDVIKLTSFPTGGVVAVAFNRREELMLLKCYEEENNNKKNNNNNNNNNHNNHNNHNNKSKFHLRHLSTTTLPHKIASISCINFRLYVLMYTNNLTNDSDNNKNNIKNKKNNNNNSNNNNTNSTFKLMAYETDPQGKLVASQEASDVLEQANEILSAIPMTSPKEEHRLHKVHIDNISEYVERKRSRRSADEKKSKELEKRSKKNEEEEEEEGDGMTVECS